MEVLFEENVVMTDEVINAMLMIASGGKFGLTKFETVPAPQFGFLMLPLKTTL